MFESLIEEAKQKQTILAQTPLSSILDVLHLLGEAWKENGAYYNEALEKLPSEISFSREMIAETLRLIPSLFKKENLLARLRAEIGDERILDGFQGKLRAFPLGLLLHVSAGNVFLGCIDSLLMGFLTKNISFLKLSSQNQIFPELFSRSLKEIDTKNILADKFYILHWKGGDQKIESLFKNQMQGILAWGGQEMLQSYKKDLGSGVKLLDFGPKISLQVLSLKAYERGDKKVLAQSIARDIALWDQQACASPQNLFFEEGLPVMELLKDVAQALRAFPLKRGELDSDEYVEIQKEKFRAYYDQAMQGGEFIEGEDFLLHYDPSPLLRPSPLNRSLIFKSFKNVEELCSQLKPFSFYLQSCSYLLTGEEKKTYLEALGLIGMKRFAPLGSIMEATEGMPHDGRFVLRELLSFVGDEDKNRLQDFLDELAKDSPYYQKALKNKISALENFPLMDGKLLGELGLPETTRGYIFSSGGTSGKSKFAYYTDEEFQTVAKLLHQGFKAQGLKKGIQVANLFAAGNLWSSFLAIDKALNLSEVTQLPIGALGEMEMIVGYLERFKPEVVFGLPSLLIQYAQFSLEKKISLEIPHIFYAGEHFSQGGQEFLSKVWKTKRFSSAGYATVDAGPIGYQCPHCAYGEHHLYSDIHMELIEEEAVVTSLYRKAMPIVRYKTGDRVVPIEGNCPCGSREFKFKLLGRVDGQINIWSSRLLVSDIEKSFSDLGLIVPLYQLRLRSEAPREILELRLEDIKLTEELIEKLKKKIYENSKDVKATHPYDKIALDIVLHSVPKDSLERVARTGKIRLIIDER